MELIKIHCPLGDCHGVVKVEPEHGVYYVRAYTENPEVPPGYRKPKPDDRVGGESFVDSQNRSEITIECTGGHYLTVSVTSTTQLPEEEFEYGPIEGDSAVRCPECKYGFGDEIEFVHELSQHDRQHSLSTVTTARPDGYAEVDALSHEVLLDADRIAHRQGCPHCGELLSFNYVAESL